MDITEVALKRFWWLLQSVLLVITGGIPVVPVSKAQTTDQPAGPDQPANGFAYGLQAHVWYFDPSAKSQVVGLVKKAGFNWIKHQVEWSTVERAQGDYDWGELDAMVNTANAAGLKVLLSVSHAPPFYRSEASGLMPVDSALYQIFMEAAASRYRGKVSAYEIWNEENLDRETGPGNVDPATYLELLKAGHTGVKSGDPGALVLLGAPSPTGANIPGVAVDDLEFVKGLYAINSGEVKQYFDALGAHPSGFSIPPDCMPDTPECSLSGGFNGHPSFFAFFRVGQYRDVMVQNDDGAKKIWFTEFGYDSTDVSVPGYEYGTALSEQQQGEFLVRAFQKARQLGYVGGMMVWNLNYQLAVPKTDEKWGFGLIRADWSPRPAFSMLAAMPKV